MLGRRTFLKLGAETFAASALPDLMAQQPSETSFRVSDRVLARVPLDFNGLSYESPQLANPAFFHADNQELVQLFRELAPAGGVLRLGGNLSAFTAWREDAAAPLSEGERAVMERGKKYWEWDLTDPTIRNGAREIVFTPECIRSLASFLRATGWKLIYGLNFATGTPQQAAAEAACVSKTVGKALLAFQLGNEDDFWRGGFRSRDWDFEHYMAEWQDWVRVIRVSAPGAPFAGPDIAVRLDWVEKMASAAKKDVLFVSGHHYAMGPAGDPRMTGEHLLGPDAEVPKEIATAQRIRDASGTSFRNTECGSCYHGGQKGVSDSYASALWAADYMLTLARAGHAGVNMHGGGEGIYSPIVGDRAKGFLRRPLYFGMQFAGMFSGAAMLDGTLSGADSLAAYAGHKEGTLLVALINKGPVSESVLLQAHKQPGKPPSEVWMLSGPSLNSQTGVTFERWDGGPASGGRWQIPAYSALLLKFPEHGGRL